MKQLITSLFLVVGCYTLAQNGIDWNTEIPVSDGTIYGNLRPRIVLTANDIPLIVYANGDDKQIYASRWNGTSFSTPVSLLPANMEAYALSWTGPDAAAKGDTVIVVFKAEPMDDGNVYVVRSVDGGISFSDTVRVDDQNEPVAWMPSLDIDENGNPSVVYMAHDSAWVNPHYVVAHSSNTGLSFNPSMNITASVPEEACDCCPAEYVINGNREVMLYRNNDNNVRDIFGIYSTDGGVTYPSVSQINMLDWVVTSCPSSGPHGLLRNDDLITVSMSRSSGKSRVYITNTPATTTLGSQTEIMMTPPSNTNGSQNFPRISGGQHTIVMAWQESNPSNVDVYCAVSTSGNVTDFLTSKAVANTNLTSSQSNPDLVYKNGIVHFVFQDSPSSSVIYKTGTIGTVSLNEGDENTLLLYPNPTTNKVMVTNCYGKNFVIKDATGHQLKTGVIDQSESISLEAFSPGIYYLEIDSNKSGYTKMVVKQ